MRIANRSPSNNTVLRLVLRRLIVGSPIFFSACEVVRTQAVDYDRGLVEVVVAKELEAPTIEPSEKAILEASASCLRIGQNLKPKLVSSQRLSYRGGMHRVLYTFQCLNAADNAPSAILES